MSSSMWSSVGGHEQRRWRPTRAQVMLVAFVALIATAAPSAAASSNRGGFTTSATIVNFDQAAPQPPGQPYGAQAVKLDEDGNHLDTGSDFIGYFRGSYYLYGESAGCGFKFNFGDFCGFRVYQSKDLVHWTPRGKLLDPATSGFAREVCRRDAATSCWGPIVVHNRKTGKYVLWFYVWAPIEGRIPFVAVGDSPTGPFSTPTTPTDIAAGAGFAPDIFVDTDGSAYMSSGKLESFPGCVIPVGCPFGLVVQKLNDSYTDGAGPAVTVTKQPVSTLLESPSILRNGHRYYLLTNPICAYCETATSYVVADSPLGPWRDRHGNLTYDPANPANFDPYPLSTDSCGGQPFHVAHLPTAHGTELNLYVSMQWYGSANEGAANHFWAPLQFQRDGLIAPIECDATARVPLASPVRTIDSPPRARNLCGAGSGNSLIQTLTAPARGQIRSIELPLYQRQRPASLGVTGFASQPLDIALTNTSSGARAARTLAPGEVSWAPTRVRLDIPVSVRRGDRLALSLSSATTEGCYETLYDVHDPYRDGRLTGDGDAEPLATKSSDVLFTASEATRRGAIEFGAWEGSNR